MRKRIGCQRGYLWNVSRLIVRSFQRGHESLSPGFLPSRFSSTSISHFTKSAFHFSLSRKPSSPLSLSLSLCLIYVANVHNWINRDDSWKRAASNENNYQREDRGILENLGSRQITLRLFLKKFLKNNFLFFSLSLFRKYTSYRFIRGQKKKKKRVHLDRANNNFIMFAKCRPFSFPDAVKLIRLI